MYGRLIPFLFVTCSFCIRNIIDCIGTSCTGTKYLMIGPVYPQRLGQFGITCRIPLEPDRERINTIIFKELVNGIFTEEARRYFNTVVERMKAQGCDAVVLGCTEIPLLIDEITSPLPTLDSTRILARAALRNALK